MTGSIARLRTAGVSVWLDDLSRERLTAGSLAALRDRGGTGVTTNPTIFARAISESDAYDAQIQDLKLRRMPADQALRELTASDVRFLSELARQLRAVSRLPCAETPEGLMEAAGIISASRIAVAARDLLKD